ncbi:type II secretion system protein GspG [Candidatus Microgenomates bacterium]|nr:type II secretion system protein GspG [Candidatus Microgenomates bacterium]
MQQAPSPGLINNHQAGFTLIELLVVVTVIAILVALTLPNLLVTQARARDDARKDDLKNIQQALESYFGDNVAYPTTQQGLAVLEPDYMNDVPADPLGALYDYESSGTTYTLTASLENPNDPSANQNGQYIILSINQ